ncbi:MAG TPA: proton-conducting transporter membrane subunit, partial [Gemmataceae bacterium]|nr:proton-conducting transporter membrane subunit [Gemmataceae bacterium]
MEHSEIDLILMTLVIFAPVAFAAPLCFRLIFPRGSDEWMRWWTLAGTGVTFALSLCMFIDYYVMLNKHSAPNTRAMASPDSLLGTRAENALASALAHAPRDGGNWVARFPWIERFNIDYYIGVDGISMPLVLLTTLLSFLAMLASWNIEKHVRGYCILFLLLETGMIGTFLALDFFLFYIFWEIMLLPMYFLIGVWGGERRIYAAMKFVLYTMVGSVLMLVAIIALYFLHGNATGAFTFSYPQIQAALASGRLVLRPAV